MSNKKSTSKVSQKKKSAKPNHRRLKVKDQLTKSSSSHHKYPPNHYYNREISWLLFNDRVLYLAELSSTPLLERLRFLNIFTNNLDEFYMKRVGGFRDQLKTNIGKLSIDHLSVHEQLDLIREKVSKQYLNFSKIYSDHILSGLRESSIELLRWNDLTKREKTYLKQYFINEVFPALTPLAVDFGHPFPFVSNLSVSLAVCMHMPENNERIFARIKVPSRLPSWIRSNPDVKKSFRFISVHDLIIQHLDHLFSGMMIDSVSLFKVTRSAVWTEDDDNAEDLLELVEEGLKERRFSSVVRLEFLQSPDPWIKDYLIEELAVPLEDVYEMPTIAHFTNFEEVIDIDNPLLKFSSHTPQVSIDLKEAMEEKGGFFHLIRNNDLLIHHPYESFNYSVERFITQAALDPDTVAIKCTLYRTDKNSTIIKSLIDAANNLKQVACVIELKARFDEERNIQWAQELENAGVHVVHGMVGLKTHSKMALVVRREFDGIKTYVHIGTGNYNAITSRLYTDISYFTCRKEITAEAMEAFNFLTGFSLKKDYKTLLLAPINMKTEFLRLIERESKYGPDGRIVCKMNQLEDIDIINALYAASKKGVVIDLIVRGFCCLKAGIPGVSDTIRVISILGRFLEHSRIFYFSNGKTEITDGSFYIGSADWMYRNLENRVEVITPIYSEENKRKLWSILEAALEDQKASWVMSPNGDYLKTSSQSGALDSQEKLIQMTEKITKR